MRILLGVVIGLIAIIVVAVVVISMNLERGVQQAIERYGPEIVGTGVHVERVSLSILSGEGELYGLQVDNLPGFKAPHLLSLERLKLGLDLRSLASDRLVVNDLTIDSPVIVVERAGGTTNLKALYDQLAGGGSEPQSQSSESDVPVVVRHFAMLDPRATLSTPAGNMTVDLPDVVLENVGENNAVTMRQFLGQVLKPLTAGIGKAMASRGTEQVKKLSQEATDKAKDLSQEATDKAQKLMDTFKRP